MRETAALKLRWRRARVELVRDVESDLEAAQTATRAAARATTSRARLEFEIRGGGRGSPPPRRGGRRGDS